MMESTLQRFTLPDSTVVDVHFDFDAWFNATEAAKPFGKEPRDWLRTQATQDYLAAVSQSANMRTEDLWSTRMGRPDQGGGTWMHPKVAVEFARWLNPFFGVQCNEVVESILRGRAIAAPVSQCGFSEGRLIDVVQSTMRKEWAQIKLDLKATTAQSRRPIPDSVKNMHLRCLDWRGWRCPLTGRAMKKEDVEFDHHFSNQLTNLEHTWPLSKWGHADVTYGRISRPTVDRFFQAYQIDLSLMQEQDKNPENFVLLPFVGKKKS